MLIGIAIAAQKCETHGNGGAVNADDGATLLVAHCNFTSNWAGHSKHSDWGFGGGAVFAGKDTRTFVVHSAFVDNHAYGGHASGGGGAIKATNAALVVIQWCTFVRNAA